MDAGANTLAFVILAIKTTKLIHTVLRSIKDGPENVRRTADDVAGLLSTLEQLSRCRALERSGCEPLEARLLRCVDDLEAFNGDIKKLEIGDVEGKRVRYWKRVKAAWGERRLEGMRVVVSGHCAALNLQLSALQSDAVFDMSDQLRTIDERLVSQRTIGEVPGQLRTITEELVSQRTVRETETFLWREQQTISARMSENVVGIRGGIDTIGREMQAMSASYAFRDTQMIERLDEILYQILNLKIQGQCENRAAEVEDDVEDNTGDETELGSVFPTDKKTAGSCMGFMESIKRLCRVIGRENGRPTIGADRDVVAALLAMLACMGSEEFLRDVVSSGMVRPERCEYCSENHLKELKACMLSVHGSLASSQRVLLNQNDETRKKSRGGYTQYQSTTSAYVLGIATIIVSSRRRVRAIQYGHLDSVSSSSWSLPLEDVTTSITIVPSAVMRVQQMFKLTTRQSDERHGVLLSIPALCVNNVLPARSLVFSVVREGRLEEFVGLLQDGRASIRDHDEYGASLLHYAARGQQPAMCRFLIESGADVNCVGGTPGVTRFSNHYLQTPLLYASFGDDPEYSEATSACRDYLLDAGCDPTTSAFWYHCYGGVLGEFILDAFVTPFLEGDIGDMKMMLEKGNPFAGVHTAARGMTPLMLYSESAPWQMEGFELLVRHGATLRDRDPEGNTCLHYCFLSIDYHEYHPHYEVWRMRDAIIYLVQQGADVFAENFDGQSVSDCAYNPNYSSIYPPTSWLGDIWDSVLANCGYDVSDFRHGRKRKGVYTPWYTRDSFEGIWAGAEHLCPYYGPQEDDVYHSGWYDMRHGDDFASYTAEYLFPSYFPEKDGISISDWHSGDDDSELAISESDFEDGGVPL